MGEWSIEEQMSDPEHKEPFKYYTKEADPFYSTDRWRHLRTAALNRSGYMSSKWKPSLIVKVDASNEEFSSPEGRKKLREDYLEGSEAGEPWILPFDSFEVQQVKPLSLNDLAINDNIQLDRKMVASIIGIPPFLLGVGDFNQPEYNNFISRSVLPIAKEIEQELTRKLILSPKMYLKFNIKSLYQYDIETLSNIYDNNYKMGVVTGNEVRDVLSLTPMDGLDELVMLENYIPAGMQNNDRIDTTIICWQDMQVCRYARQFQLSFDDETVDEKVIYYRLKLAQPYIDDKDGLRKMRIYLERIADDEES